MSFCRAFLATPDLIRYGFRSQIVGVVREFAVRAMGSGVTRNARQKDIDKHRALVCLHYIQNKKSWLTKFLYMHAGSNLYYKTGTIRASTVFTQYLCQIVISEF